MFTFLSAVTCPETGRTPQIGDSDNAVALELDSSGSSRYISLLNTGTVLFGDRSFKVHDDDLDEYSYWLLGGRKAKERFASLPKGEPVEEDRLVSFDSGGYHVFDVKNNEGLGAKLIFDSGPLGYLSIAAHGHADALAITLLVNGEEILADPGTYAYHTERVWRDYFRSTHAHNTMTVNNENQSVIGGAFLWTKKAAARTIKHIDDSESLGISGSHDGYQRLAPPVTHYRTVTWDRNARIFRIVDKVDASAAVDIALRFHLGVGVAVEEKPDNTLILSYKNAHVGLKLPGGLSVERHRGAQHPDIRGWYSRHLGIKVPVWTITARGTVQPHAELKTGISFATNPEDALNRVFT